MSVPYPNHFSAVTMESLYVLSLTCGKYLVGKSKNVPHTYAYYDAGFGPQWIQTYYPLRIVETRPLTGPDDVRMTTLKLMKEHGIDCVRPYDYGEMRLDDVIERTLRFQMHAPPDACTKCHATGHSHKDCTHEENTSWACQWCISDYPNRYACEQHEKTCRPPKTPLPPPRDWCTRCGRTEHVAARCFEVKHTEGWRLPN